MFLDSFLDLKPSFSKKWFRDLNLEEEVGA